MDDDRLGGLDEMDITEVRALARVLAQEVGELRQKEKARSIDDTWGEIAARQSIDDLPVEKVRELADDKLASMIEMQKKRIERLLDENRALKERVEEEDDTQRIQAELVEMSLKIRQLEQDLETARLAAEHRRELQQEAEKQREELIKTVGQINGDLSEKEIETSRLETELDARDRRIRHLVSELQALTEAERNHGESQSSIKLERLRSETDLPVRTLERIVELYRDRSASDLLAKPSYMMDFGQRVVRLILEYDRDRAMLAITPPSRQ